MPMLARSPLCLALAVLLALPSLLTPGTATAEDSWSGFSATSFLEFYPAILGDLGIAASAIETGDGAVAAGKPGKGTGLGAALAFSVLPSSSVVVHRNGGHFKGFESGTLRHAGGPVLELPDGGRLRLRGFSLEVASPRADFDLLDAAGTRWLILDNMQWESSADGSRLWLLGLDVLLAPELAERIGRPDLAGSFIGTMDIALPSPPRGSSNTALAEGPCVDDFSLPQDLELIDLRSLSQGAREAGVRVALSAAAELRNVGQGAIPWYQTIEPDAPAANIGEHPYLALNFYRIAGGAIEQLGRSDVKHAYRSINTGCACDVGHVIYPTCEDIYGVNTNLDRIHLGPREELTARSGAWQRLGSHFDGIPVDDFRDHLGDAVHDDFEHRLVVSEPELSTAGAQYFLEGWYVFGGDIDPFNSMGHRSVSPLLVGNTWSFSMGGSAPTLGSVLDEFVDPLNPPPGSANTLLDTGHGTLQLAAASVDLGGGITRYEYALMNFDFDAEIRSFTVPIVSGTTPTNLGFRAADKDPAGDWTPRVGSRTIVWTAPRGDELPWGTLFNFRFDADAAPVTTVIDLEVSDSSVAPAALAVASVGPAPPPDCSDGLDNDGDGLVDFASAGGDPGCYRPATVIEDPQCQDGIDNDSDGFTDFDAGLSAGAPLDPDGPDPQCTGPTYNRETPSSASCGMGIELLLVVPALALLRAPRRARRR
jgi:hypothetical protein